jgi:hypothetical protein
MTPGLPGAVGVLDERRVQGRDVAQGAHDGVADEVGEADLGPRGAGQLVVENLPVHLEQAGGDGAHARRRRHAEAGLHVGHDPAGGAPRTTGLLRARALAAGAALRRGGCGCGWSGERWGGDGGLDRNAWGPGRGGPVVGEELAPAVAHRGRIDQKRSYMSSTSHALGPKEPAAPLTVPWTHPTGGARGVGAGRYRHPYPWAIRPDSTFIERAGPCRGAGRRPRARLAGPGRELPAGHAPPARAHIVAYDRRGYQGSRGAGVVGLHGHIADLVDILAEVRARGAGHRRGRRPQRGRGRRDRRRPGRTPGLRLARRLRAPHAVARLSAPRPGDDDRPGCPLAEDPAEEVERFFSRMVSPSAWRACPTRAGPAAGPTGRRWWPTSSACAATPVRGHGPRRAGPLRDGRPE